MAKSYVNSIIDSMRHAVWVVELNPRAPADATATGVIHVNPAAATLLHCAPHALKGRPLVDIVPAVTSGGFEWWAAVATGQDVSGVELDLIGPNRVEVPVLLAASTLPPRSGKGQQIICIAQDMTQLRLTEHLLRENDRLTQEITALRMILNRRPSGTASNDE